MISCKITELKNFMSKLLTSDCFDMFLLEQAVITTYNTFTIDGHIEKEFYTSEEWEDPSLRPYKFSCWSEIRPICFSLIKGRKTPVSMKYILRLKPETMQKLFSDAGITVPNGFIDALIITIRYNANGMSCTTGISFSDFLPDKTPEKLWDKSFSQFLDNAGILNEII